VSDYNNFWHVLSHVFFGTRCIVIKRLPEQVCLEEAPKCGQWFCWCHVFREVIPSLRNPWNMHVALLLSSAFDPSQGLIVSLRWPLRTTVSSESVMSRHGHFVNPSHNAPINWTDGTVAVQLSYRPVVAAVSGLQCYSSESTGACPGLLTRW